MTDPYESPPSPPPDYVLELLDVKADRRIVKRIKISNNVMNLNSFGRSRQAEYEISIQARNAFRDAEYLNGNWPPKKQD